MEAAKIWLLEQRLNNFASEANSLFSSFESSSTRTHTLDESYQKLSSLSLKQDDLFRQSLRCVEVGVFRAAHVMAWAGFVDCLLSLVASDSFSKLNNARPNWSISSLEQLSENYTEFAIIDAMRVMNALGKSEAKALHGMLSKRNECAHPGNYFPGFNETLGYISEIFARLRSIDARYPNLILV